MRFHFPLPFISLALVLAAGIFVLIVVFNQPTMQQPLYDHAIVRIGTTTVRAEVADTPARRQLGLSGHAPLEENDGMLFVYGEGDDGAQGFWMKDMLFPIDIIWIDVAGNVITIAHSVAPESYPEVFYPARAAHYVLEVQAGFAKRHGIAEGAKVVVEY